MRNENNGSEISKVMRLMEDAIGDGERGLQQHRSANIRRCAAAMSRGYETALSLSLKLSLTSKQCQTFDNKSHQVESMRVRLERLGDDFARREFALHRVYSEKRGRPSAFRATVRFLDHCFQFADTAKAMKQMNADIMRRSFHR